MALCLLTLGLVATTAPDDGLREHLFRDGTVAWQSMEGLYLSLAGTQKSVGEVTWPGEPKQITSESRTFCFTQYGMAYWENTEGSDGKREYVYAINDTYEFVIYRNPSQYPWTIDQLTARHEQRNIGDRFRVWQNTAKTLAPIGLYDSRLLDTITPDTVTSVGLSNGSVDVEFEIPHGLLIHKGTRPSQNDYLLGGTVMLDREKWTVVKYEVQIRFGTDGVATIRGDMEYEGSLDGAPLPRRYVESLDDLEETGIAWRNVYEFSDLRKCDLPAQDFTLTAYGLPEPDFGVDHRYVRMIFIVCGAVILLLILGMWMRRRSYT